jgi:formylglycine-generating enzyme required for sulfatase activity
MLCAASPLWAQASASYFSQIDQQGDVDAAGHCLRTFSSALLAAGLVERPSSEVETLMRECVEDRSNPGFVRECDLSTARGQVNFVFLVGAEQDGEDWLFYIQALSPMMAGAVWQLDELTSASSALRAARDGCAYLAADFLYRQEFVTTPPQRQNTSGGAVATGGVVVPDALPAVVHVVSVTPSPSSFYVNGREVGLAPGQFEVPAGVATPIELRSPGYTPWSRTVTVASGGTERLENISLAALPATLQLTANVQGADILVDGAVVGTTVLNRAVSVSVPSGSRQLTVRLDGFDDYQSSVTLAPGATQSLTAALSATPVGPPPAPSGFVYIAPGSFTMGSPSNEEGRSDDETQHSVTLTRGFYLQTTEVTQGEWQRVMGNNPSFYPTCGSSCPVDRVSWWDAVAYANVRSRSEGLQECYVLSGCSGVAGSGAVTGDNAPRYGTGDYTCSSVSFSGLGCTGYRLPTESEWEYAARAGTSGPAYVSGTLHGSQCSPNAALARIAWFNVNSLVSWESNSVATVCSSTERRGPQPVARLQANAWGLQDMLGNVWEWTQDWYGNYAGSVTDPAGPSSGSHRVARGGSCFNYASFVRAAIRDYVDPAYRGGNLGFRLARSAP